MTVNLAVATLTVSSPGKPTDRENFMDSDHVSGIVRQRMEQTVKLINMDLVALKLDTSIQLVV